MNIMVMAFIGGVHLDLSQSHIFFSHRSGTRRANSIYRAFRERIYGLRRIPKAANPRCTALLPLCRVFSPRRRATANFEGRIARVPSLYVLHILRSAVGSFETDGRGNLQAWVYKRPDISRGMGPSAAEPA